MNGVLSFCDILGYKSFLKNNSAIESAKDVLDIINEAPQAIQKMMNEFWPHMPGNAEINKEVSETIQHLVFSDTIVLMLPYPENAIDYWQEIAIAYITFFTAHLKKRMFLRGLPLRCVIHEGEFISRQACLAGKAIVEAYELVDRMGLSSIAFSPTLGTKIFDSRARKPIFTEHNFEQFFIDYLTPLNKGEELKLLHFNWLIYVQGDDFESCVRDPEYFTLKSFWAHRKDCPASVDVKVSATSKLFRRFLMAHEQLREKMRRQIAENVKQTLAIEDDSGDQKP